MSHSSPPLARPETETKHVQATPRRLLLVEEKKCRLLRPKARPCLTCVRSSSPAGHCITPAVVRRELLARGRKIRGNEKADLNLLLSLEEKSEKRRDIRKGAKATTSRSAREESSHVQIESLSSQEPITCLSLLQCAVAEPVIAPVVEMPSIVPPVEVLHKVPPIEDVKHVSLPSPHEESVRELQKSREDAEKNRTIFEELILLVARRDLELEEERKKVSRLTSDLLEAGELIEKLSQRQPPPHIPTEYYCQP